MEEIMEGILFLVLWIGGAAIHTLAEVYWRSVRTRRTVAIGATGRNRKYEGDGY
jgi:hypothetical protein